MTRESGCGLVQPGRAQGTRGRVPLRRVIPNCCWRGESSSLDYLFNGVEPFFRRDRGRPEPDVPAGQRLPGSAGHPAFGPVHLLGPVPNRVRRPGLTLKRAGPVFRAASVLWLTRPFSFVPRHDRHDTGPLDEPGADRRPWGVHPHLAQAATSQCCCCCSARFSRNLRARVLTELEDH